LSIIKEIIFKEFSEKVNTVNSLSGGSINKVYRCQTTTNDLAIKINQKDHFPNMFEKEKLGLEYLARSPFIIPKVISVGNFNNLSFIILEHIQSGKPINWGLFGENLAALHNITNDQFGLDHDNYIGSLVQLNTYEKTWEDFYINQRILALTIKARDKGLMNYNDCQKTESLCQNLSNIIPYSKPALIHGDLWTGNLISNQDGDPVLIDPAIYYGHPEMDIAMLYLFGSVPQLAIESYQSIKSMEKGWEDRLDLHQLYPLLVHLLLFGEGYYNDVINIINKYN